MSGEGSPPNASRSEPAVLAPWLAVGLVVSLALLLPSLRLGFLYEDARLILINRGPAAHLLASFGETRDGFYRPLSALVLGLQGNLFGDWAMPYHIVSLALHGACSVLVWRIASRSAGRIAGAVVLLVFLGGGTHVEAIFWISSVNALLATLAVLLATDVLLRRDPPGRFAQLGATALAAIGALAKESVFTFPVAMIALWLVQAPASFADRVRARLVFVVSGLAWMAAFAPLRAASGWNYELTPSPELLAKNAAYYALTLLLALPDDYRYLSDLTAWRESPWLAAASLALVAPLGVWLWSARARLAWRSAGAWLVWSAAGSVVALPILAERNAYTPSAGTAIALAVLVAPCLAEGRPVRRLVAGVLALFLAAHWLALAERGYWWGRASDLSHRATAAVLQATALDPPGTRVVVYNVPDRVRFAQAQGPSFRDTLELRSGGRLRASDVEVHLDSAPRSDPGEILARAAASAGPAGPAVHALVLDDGRVVAEARAAS